MSGRPVAARLRVVAGIAAVAVVAAGAVLSDGFDAQRTTRVESSVWVARDAGQYARFDTELGQIDAVHQVADPMQVAQQGSTAAVLTQGLRTVWQVDGADPVDLDKSQGADTGSAATPDGTTAVVGAGRWLLYRTDAGELWVQTLGAAVSGSATRLAPDPADDGATARQYRAAAATIDPAGRVAVYSAEEEAVRLLDAGDGRVLAGPIRLNDPPPSNDPVQLTLVGGRWVLADPSAGRVWLADRVTPVAVDVAKDAQLQAPAADGAAVYLADGAGLVAIDLGSGTVSRPVQADGTPTQPVALDDGVVVAAWLSTRAGRLWTSDRSGTRTLQVDTAAMAQVHQVHPAIESNGDRAVLEETGTGLMWTVPDGVAVPLSQWSRIDQATTTAGTMHVDDVTEEMPPVAVADSFGVRSGAYVRLPVLLNDHDPNAGDVLTVDPGSLTGGLSPGDFGEVSLTDDDQLLVVHVRATSGSAVFSYQVTDGVLTSAPVQVTLHVVAPGANAAPVWCGVESCVQSWPSPAVAPGGTVRLPILDDWVDPDGDPFVLSAATLADPAAPLQLVTGADGTLTIHHTDPNGPARSVQVAVTVTDSAGAASTRTLDVQVTSSPALAVEPVSLVVGVGSPGTIRVDDHVTAGSGSYRLVDAVAASASAGHLTVTPNGSDGTVSVTAHDPGRFQVTYTVHDEVTGTERSAVLRVTCPQAAAAVSMAPMTAFVREHEDTTLDVLSAVRSTSDHVFMVSEATTTDPALGVDVVNSDSLRLRGSTPDGRPGKVGTVTLTVTDGGASTATGTVTVFLVDATTGGPPIALPDTATVRAGAQVDIPVTANDVAPGGASLVVSGEVVGSGQPGELAFGSGRLVRYVAPNRAGTYTLHYTVQAAGDPTALATSTVTVTVVGAGADRSPAPSVLVARVVAGQTVTIPFDGTGVDPDGDPVALVAVDQPAAGQGAARVVDTGDAIEFRAPSTLAAGAQISFAYRVRDPAGTEASGTVRVGVLAAGSGAPIAYSDRVRVQQGESAPVTIEPLLNDHDPVGGTLTLTELRPDAPDTPSNPERARLAGLIDRATSLTHGTVVLRAGDELGVHAYVYTVRSSASGSTAEGLVVVDVVAASSAQPPTVTDTVVTARQRGELSTTGLDVVDGAVTWPTGDISTLSLAVTGATADRYSVRGNRIFGPAPPSGELVPFLLTGVDHDGLQVQARAFLRIPAFDDMRVSVRDRVAPVTVDEGSTVDVDLLSQVALATGDRIEVAPATSEPVQRAAARCSTTDGTTVRYQAGNGAPWTDSCAVQVRLVGQTTWSDVLVPVTISPKAPQAELSSLSRTVAPGASETIDLHSMTSWQGGRVGDVTQLVYATSLQGAAFTLEQKGAQVTVTASAGAVPGTRSTVAVRVAAFGGLRSTIDLMVGQAAPDTPRGATVSAECDVSRGASCAVDVVGVAGEYDPFAGRPGAGLTLSQVGDSGTVDCGVASVRSAGPRQVTVTWPTSDRPAGGTCKVAFTVVDAQGRVGAGRLDLDVLGFPSAPASLTATSYSGTGVTLDVALGAALAAHPAVSGAAIYEGGRLVSDACRPSGAAAYRCTVSGLVNGEQHSYTARVRNRVGESADTSPLTTWAYQPPAVDAVSAEPADDPAALTATQGPVTVHVTAGEDVSAFTVTGRTDPVARTGRTTDVPIVLPVGQQTVTVTPVSRFAPPVGSTDATGGSAQTTVLVAGLPVVSAGTATASGTTITVTGAGVDPNGSARPVGTRYAVWTGAAPTCSMDPSGAPRISGGAAIVSSTPTFSGLTNDTDYQVMVCGSNGFAARAATPAGAPLFLFTGFPAPSGSPTYAVDPAPGSSKGVYTYTVATAPTLRADRGLTLTYSFDGGASWVPDFALPPTRPPGPISARQCSRIHPTACSDPVAVTAKTGSATATVAVTTTAPGCDAGVSPFTGFSSTAAQDAATVAANSVTEGSDLVTTWTLTWQPGSGYDGLEPISLGNAAKHCPVPVPPPGG